MTMKPFFLQHKTIFLLMKLNLQQTVTGTTDSPCDRNKYEYKMTHWTNAAQDAHLSWKLWKMPGRLMRKLRSPIPNAKCPRSWESGRYKSSLNTPSAWAPILSKEEGYKGIAGRGLRNPDLRAGLFDAALFNLGPPIIQQDELVKGKSLGGISTSVMDSRLQRKPAQSLSWSPKWYQSANWPPNKTWSQAYTTKETSTCRKNFYSHFISNGDKRFCHIV